MVADDALRAGRREWLGLAVLALPTLLLSLDFSVLYLALPSLTADLGASSTQQLWIMDIYGFVVAGFLVTMGSLGDRIGRRRLMLIGAGAFGVASLLAAFSTSPEMLIVTRALMGVAGACLMPSTLSLISTMFPSPRQMGVAIAVWMSCFMGGLAIGPVVGGIMLEFFWWGSVFLLGVPVMVLLLITGPLLLPEYRDAEGGRLDMVSAALSLAALLPVIYGLKELAKDGWAVLPACSVVLGLLIGAVFVLRQRRLTSPLLDMRLFGNRTFSAALVLWLLSGAVQGGTSFLVAIQLQSVAGLSPLHAGLWLVPSTVLMIFSIMMAPILARRFRPASVMATGMVLAGLGYLLITQVESADGLTVLLIGWALALSGLGLPSGLSTALILGSAPPEKAGSASAMSETTSEFGIALGVAALGSLSTAVYRWQTATTIPDDVPPEAAEAARDSITAAVFSAEQVPGAAGEELLHVAREAFTTGLTTVAGIAAALFIVLAAIAATALRHVNTNAEAPVEQDDRRQGDQGSTTASLR
ncbi:DHA2 family multidrug resistance protein-like MFS transporter [Actinoalloteichus hoggarensis]|uniref:Antiseptic resistance protein n=1 Tax=Actinoalloteichus hoggarensis TaxID=1470176 RepID=A0A221W4W4_9PSEU|nr:MFS transporter [Actinoalloteichus hoggarensis]ASO20905.1 Antiseptic resistance protein [Actinoalloteichus hoggarensis]MBB5920835.1 DHA2 family multidrug resistance protein-like MFS transporter [Actinoalloteichus hoggarensis]